MQDELTNIKNVLVDGLKFINNGFANLYLDETASKYVSLDGKTNVALGIDDRYANYFYLRSNGNMQVSNGKRLTGCVPTLQLNDSISLVVNVAKASPDKLLECVLNALAIYTKEDFEVTRIYTTNEKVVKSEYAFLGQDAIKQILARLSGRTLLKIEFTLFKEFQPNPRDCYKCNPCLDC